MFVMVPRSERKDTPRRDRRIRCFPHAAAAGETARRTSRITAFAANQGGSDPFSSTLMTRGIGNVKGRPAMARARSSPPTAMASSPCPPQWVLAVRSQKNFPGAAKRSSITGGRFHSPPGRSARRTWPPHPASIDGRPRSRFHCTSGDPHSSRQGPPEPWVCRWLRTE